MVHQLNLKLYTVKKRYTVRHGGKRAGGYSLIMVIHIWTLQPSWSCDLDNLYKQLFLLPMEDPYEI